MNLYYTPYMLTSIAAAIIAAGLVPYAWRNREISGARALAFMLLGVALWSTGEALTLGSASLTTLRLALIIQYAGIVGTPVSGLVFIIHYTGNKHYLTRRNLIVLLAIPLITLILVITNPAHGLMWRDVILDTSTPYSTVTQTSGPWLLVHFIYTGFITLLGLFLLLQMFINSPKLYRSQVMALIIGALVPIAWNTLRFSGFWRLEGLNLTAPSFAISGVIYIWVMFRFRLLDMIPAAYSSIVESMHDGIIVIDVQDRVVVINPAGAEITGVDAAKVTGQPATVAFGHQRDLLMHLHERAPGIRMEIIVSRDPNVHTYELRVSSLVGPGHTVAGYVAVLHDITERKQFEDKLRDLSLTDELTGLYNRRGFLILAEQQFKVARREGQFASLLFADINGLKAINDSLGHKQGDQALIDAANALQQVFRQTDIIARLGGDEFAVLLTNASKPNVAQLKERIYNVLAHSTADQRPYQLSLSVGIAFYDPSRPRSLVQLLDDADAHMYIQKRGYHTKIAESPTEDDIDFLD